MEYLFHSTLNGLYSFSNHQFGFIHIISCKTLNLIHTIPLKPFSDVQTSINDLLTFFKV